MYLSFSSRSLGKSIQFDEHIFHIGLVQPPTSNIRLMESRASWYGPTSSNYLPGFYMDPRWLFGIPGSMLQLLGL